MRKPLRHKGWKRERATGVEPATSSLGSWHSTTELRPRTGADGRRGSAGCQFAARRAAHEHHGQASRREARRAQTRQALVGSRSVGSARSHVGSGISRYGGGSPPARRVVHGHGAAPVEERCRNRGWAPCARCAGSDDGRRAARRRTRAASRRRRWPAGRPGARRATRAAVQSEAGPAAGRARRGAASAATSGGDGGDAEEHREETSGGGRGGDDRGRWAALRPRARSGSQASRGRPARWRAPPAPGAANRQGERPEQHDAQARSRGRAVRPLPRRARSTSRAAAPRRGRGAAGRRRACCWPPHRAEAPRRSTAGRTAGRRGGRGRRGRATGRRRAPAGAASTAAARAAARRRGSRRRARGRALADCAPTMRTRFSLATMAQKGAHRPGRRRRRTRRRRRAGRLPGRVAAAGGAETPGCGRARHSSPTWSTGMARPGMPLASVAQAAPR